MIVQSLRKLGFAVVLTGVSMFAGAAATAQTSDGEGDEGPNAEASAAEAQEFAQMRNWMAEEAARQRRFVETLRTSAAPRDWAVASQIFVYPDSDSSDAMAAMEKRQSQQAELLRTAALAAPDDKLVQWLALFEMPHAGGGCASPAAPRDRVDAVLRLEPDNGFALLPALKEAVAAKDATAIDTVLAQIAAAPRHDDHVADYTLVLLDVAARHPDAAMRMPDHAANALDADDVALLGASMQARQIGASLYGLTKVCDAAEQTDADLRRFAACADIGRRLSRESPNFTVRLTGFDLLRKSAQFDETDAAAERELRWLTEQAQGLAEREQAGFVPAARRAWLESRDDVASMRAVLGHYGISATPSAGWMPRDDDASDESSDASSDETGGR
ncbi:MAG TPA: hypothetical protein VJ724_11005 [Tahibacter sp.]|nr:hypothetical protein [Tahibacter sp.]